MAGTQPSINDREWNLIFKFAYNLYTYAVASGVAGLNPPNLNDTEDILLKKATYYSASLV